MLMAAGRSGWWKFGSQAGAGCGNLCDPEWWKTATTVDLQAELDAGADAMARNKDGGTPLHAAASYDAPAKIQALLAALANDPVARAWFPPTMHDIYQTLKLWKIGQAKDQPKDALFERYRATY